MAGARDPGATARALAMVALVPAAMLSPGNPLSNGGLAGLAGAAVVAGSLGVPLAAQEWRGRALLADRSTRGWRAVAPGIAEGWTLLAIGAAVGPAVHAAGIVGAIAALCGWLALSRFGGGARGVRALLVPAALALAVALAAAAAPIAPWTLLEPRADGWRAWATAAAIGGPLLASVGLGTWSATEAAPGEPSRRPWAAVGGGVLASLVALAAGAFRFEEAEVAPITAGLFGNIAVAALCLAAAGSALARPGAGRGRALGGAVATVWFGGPGFAVIPWFWAVLLPFGLAFGVLASADRRWAGALALAMAVGTTVGWPGVPDRPLDAAAAALTGVVALWVAVGQAAARLPAEAA